MWFWCQMCLRVSRFCGAFWMIAGILLLTLPSAAQVNVGDVQMSLSGNIGANYNGGINQAVSSHGLGFSGDGNLFGSYYSPNFLNFTVAPYYGYGQSNSVFGSLTNSAGVSSTVNLFGGSHFPGSISYGKYFNSTGTYGIPESSVGLSTNGNNQGFAVSWSALLPDWPTLTATYASSSGSNSVYGVPGENDQSTREIGLTSSYNIAGFHLSGGFLHRSLDGNFTELLSGGLEPIHSQNSSNTYQFNGTHSFPMNGSYTVSWSRTNYGYNSHDSNDYSSSGTTDSLNGTLGFNPLPKLSTSFFGDYYDNLLSFLPEPIVNGGTTVNLTNLGGFKGAVAGAYANYQLLHNLSLGGTVTYTDQWYLGQNYHSTQFSANANYNIQHNLLGGLSFNATAFDYATKEGNTQFGFVLNLNYARKVAHWELDGNFSYSQGVQTLVILDTASSYSWVANARRRLGTRSFFMVGYGGSHSGFTIAANQSSSTERFSSTFIYRTYSLNGFYSKSHGTAAFTTNGLVALPGNLPPSVLPPDAVTVFDSEAWGANVGATIRRRLTISAGYGHSTGSTLSPSLNLYVKNNLANASLQYRLRKIFVNGGYTRLQQSVSTTSPTPVVVTSYWIGVSRWFNFF